MPAIYVLQVPEFAALVTAATRPGSGCDVTEVAGGYTRISHPAELVFERKALGVKPAVWYGLFTGGLDGEIVRFDRDLVRIVPMVRP